MSFGLFAWALLLGTLHIAGAHGGVVPSQHPGAMEAPAARQGVPAKAQNDVFIHGGDAATIPYRSLVNLIYFPVTVNGHAFHFVLDSGASTDVLEPRAARAAGIASSSAMSTQGAGPNAVDTGIAEVRELVMGGAVAVRNRTIYTVPLPEVFPSLPVDGIVGLPFLKRFVVRVDYVQHTLTVMSPSAFHPAGAGVPIAVEFFNGFSMVHASLDGLTGTFAIDSGDANAVEIAAPFAKAHGLYARYAAYPAFVDGIGVGGGSTGRIARGGKLVLGPFVIDHPVMNLSTATGGVFHGHSFDGTIGGETLKRFTVTFDYPDGRIYLKPNANYGAPMPNITAGMIALEDRRGFVVLGVMPGGPAAEAGIKAGDIITSVNGERAASIGELRFMLMQLHGTPGARWTLGVDSGKRAHTTTLVLRRLFPRPESSGHKSVGTSPSTSGVVR